jgi:hypothetical protein
MPFDFKSYDARCATMDADQLQREWQHYTRLISCASTSTAVSGLAFLPTLGLSIIGISVAAPTIHNARKKREIIEKHLQRLGTTLHTRKRDVLGSVAFSGAVGVATLGASSAGGDAIFAAGVEHGISAIAENKTAVEVVTDVGYTGVNNALEHVYTEEKRQGDARKASETSRVSGDAVDPKKDEAGC